MAPEVRKKTVTNRRNPTREILYFGSLKRKGLNCGEVTSATFIAWLAFLTSSIETACSLQQFLEQISEYLTLLAVGSPPAVFLARSLEATYFEGHPVWTLFFVRLRKIPSFQSAFVEPVFDAPFQRR